MFVFPFNFRSDAHAASCERLALPARASNSSKRFLGCQLRATEGAPPPSHTSQLSRFPSVHNTLSLGKVLTHTHARVPPRFTRKPLSSQLVTEGAEDGRRRTGGASPPPPLSSWSFSRRNHRKDYKLPRLCCSIRSCLARFAWTCKAARGMEKVCLWTTIKNSRKE